MKVGLYCRVSTLEQAKEGYSLNEQAERLQKFADAMNWPVFKIYTDGGFSGASLNRPALQDLIHDIDKLDKVVVWKLDRLSRSQKDTLYLVEDVFLKNGCDFISMQENFDTSTPFGKAMVGILSVFAQLEREQIKERTNIGREGRAKIGKYHGGGFIPVGYDYIDGELVVNEFEAMQIQEIHKLYQSGMSIRAIARDLNERGLTHKNGEWSAKRVKNCMTNELYIGKIHFNGKLYTGNHSPIISQDTYDKTNELFNSFDYSYCKHKGNKSFLGTLLFCKHCGARYGLYVIGKYKYYVCYSRRKCTPSMIKDPNCKNKNYRMETLDQIVFNEIRKLALEPDKIKSIKKEDEGQKETIILKEIEKIDLQKSRLMDLYSVGGIALDEIASKIAPLSDRKSKLEEDLKSIKKSPISVKEAVKKVTSFSDVLNSGDFDNIRQIILALIDRIDIDNNTIEIHWKFC